SPPRRKHRHFR
ncbi:hypothetical protein LSH36_1134g00001, partial [Paralvinella palmiformis]